MSVQHLWAKSYPDDSERYHPLWCHLLDVAAVCRALVPRFGGIGDIPDDWLPYLVALHDIGKADARFQGKAPKLAGLLAGLGVPVDSEGASRGFRHEARSAEWLLESLKAGPTGWEKEAALVAAQATRGHHGDFGVASRMDALYNEREWPWAEFYQSVRRELAALVAETLKIQPHQQKRFLDASVVGMKLSGLIVLSDWIASNPETYRYPDLYSKQDFGKEPGVYWTEAQKEAKLAVQTLKLDGGERAEPVFRTFHEVWPSFSAEPPRPTQAALEALLQHHSIPGLLIIEAPMGEGKTEAALYAATCWNRPGVYIALPTQATSNQMHRRLRLFLGEDRAPRLVHGMAWLLDDKTPDKAAQTWGAETDDDERQLSRDWFANAKRALLAADGVGTVDQALMAALSVKHGFLRFLGLTTKTLIIDEVHAYDLYMTTLMKMLLRWCRALDVPVILLSATLSQAQKRGLAEAYGGPGSLPALSGAAADEPYPLLTLVPPASGAVVEPVPPDPHWSRVIGVQPHPGALGNPAQIARLAAEAVAGGGCACVLANTVGSAQEIFGELVALRRAGLLPRTKLYLFHARYRAEKRQERENTIVARFGKKAGKSRPRRAIVVGTQVLEQSLDIDFDVMLSEIAPIDLLLQRSGRLHRHEANNPRPTGMDAVLHVLLPEKSTDPPKFGGMEIQKWGNDWRGVYDRAALLRTLALLHTLPLLEGKPSISLPADFRPLIEGCYDPKRLPVSSFPAEWIIDAEKLRTARQDQSEQNAKTHLIPYPDEEEFSYADIKNPEAEAEEGERANYFRLSTREGDDSRTVLVLHDAALFAAVQAGGRWEREKKQREEKQEWRPGKDTLKKLFLQKVSLPAYWLAGVAPAEGYEWLDKDSVPKRLRHHQVLLMRDRVWKGSQTTKTKQAGEVTITDHVELGLCWLAEKE